jgi:hypothetical protein
VRHFIGQEEQRRAGGQACATPAVPGGEREGLIRAELMLVRLRLMREQRVPDVVVLVVELVMTFSTAAPPE